MHFNVYLCKYRLLELLRTRLRECGWRDKLTQECKGKECQTGLSAEIFVSCPFKFTFTSVRLTVKVNLFMCFFFINIPSLGNCSCSNWLHA